MIITLTLIALGCLGAVALVATRNAPARHKNMRGMERIAAKGSFLIFWQEPDGATRRKKVRAIDISEHGASFRSSVPFEYDSFIYIHAEKYNLAGIANVRHCTRQGMRYKIGVDCKTTLRRMSEA